MHWNGFLGFERVGGVKIMAQPRTDLSLSIPELTEDILIHVDRESP